MTSVNICCYWFLLAASVLILTDIANVNGCLECGGEDPVVTENKNADPKTNSESADQTKTTNSLSENKSNEPPSVEEPESDNTESKKQNFDKNDSPNKIEEPPHLKEYKKLFLLHRNQQIEVIKNIATSQNIEQRNKLISLMLKQLFITLGEARENLTVAGYLPGDPFPEDNQVKESMSKVLENTAMFGDLMLFLPDIVHSLYDKEKEWQVLLAWSYGFCTQSNVFEGNHKSLLTLMAMESNIIPKAKDYINPFKSYAQLQSLMDSMKKDEKKNKTKKAKRKIERGPKLRKTEL